MNTTESAAKTVNTQPITYAELRNSYEKYLDGNGRGGVFANHSTALNIFQRVNGLTDSSEVSDEFDTLFQKKLSLFITSQEEDGIKASTYTSRASYLKAIRNFYTEHVVPERVPSNFAVTLKRLVAHAGHTMTSFGREIIPDLVRLTTFNNWGLGYQLPSCKYSLNVIREIEIRLGADEGDLTSLLPTRRFGAPKPPTGTTLAGRRSQEAMQKPYRVWTKGLKKEFDEIVKYKSSVIPPKGEKRSLKGVWSSSEGAHLPSANINQNFLMGFFGYCHLPVEGDDPHMKGHGIPLKSLSIALLADKTLVEGYIEFMKCRTLLGLAEEEAEGDPEAAAEEDEKPVTGKYNQGPLQFLGMVASYLSEKTGYIYQHPEYAEKLGSRMTEDTWERQCLVTRIWASEMYTNIAYMRKTGDYSQYEMGRDPKDPIKEIIEQDRPLFVIQRMIKRMLGDFNLGNLSTLRAAELYRNILFVALMAANPLRVRQFSIMKFGKHLRRREDGSWWIHFRKGDFKNRKSLDSDYEVRVVPELWPLIDRYREKFRPVLLDGRSSDFVFVSYQKGRLRKNPNDQMRLTTKGLNALMMCITRTYMSGLGFGPHAFRHIVATDIIKQDPRTGFYTASKVLHDKLVTVEREYIHLKTSELFEPYNDHFSEAWKEVFGGQALK